MNHCLSNYIGRLFCNETLHHLPIGFVGSGLIFLIYLEASPNIRNVWYRMGNDGKRHLNIPSLLHFLSRPFKDRLLWHPRMWDLNWITFTICGTMLYVLIRRSYNLISPDSFLGL